MVRGDIGTEYIYEFVLLLAGVGYYMLLSSVGAWLRVTSVFSQVTKDHQIVDHLVAGDDSRQTNDSDICATVDHVSMMLLLEDVESSDLQFHSIHTTNRSDPLCASF